MSNSLYRATTGLSFLLLISGCTVGRDYRSPDLANTSQPLISQDDKTRSLIPIKSREPVEQWWAEFNDPVLSDLISKALNENYDIRIAKARIEQARQFSLASNTQRLPSLDVRGNASRRQISQNSGTSSTNSGAFTLYEAGFDSSWELDLFGRVTAQIKSDRLELQAREADLRAVYVSVAAEIARSYIRVRAAQYRKKVAEKNLANQQASLDLIRKLVDGGRSTELDIARAETLLQLTKSTLPQLDADISTSINRIAVLTAQTPADFVIPEPTNQPLPSLPKSLAIGTTQSLLSRRGDVSASQRRLMQSIANYNVAVADLYPRLTLNGSIGFAASDFSSLTENRNKVLNFGPSISWAVFNRTRIKAVVRANDAVAQASLAEFEKTVVSALEEIRSSMTLFTQEEQRRDSLRLAALAAGKATNLARERFKVGIDNYLDVLDAERTQLEAEDQLALSESQVFTNLISIYKALGGGWQVAIDD